MNILKTFKKRLSFKKPHESILFILALLIIFFYFNKYVLSNMNVENFENTSNDRRKVVYFYMNGCGHCNTFSPIWDEFIQSCPISTEEIESDDIGEARMKKYSISGFPTIVLLDENDNKLKELQDRTIQGLNDLIS